MKPHDLIESNCNFKTRQYFVKKWERFLDNCEKLLKTDPIKPDDPLTILNCVNNDIQFLGWNQVTASSLFLSFPSQNQLEPADSKLCVSYLSNYLKTCLKNILFCSARRMFV